MQGNISNDNVIIKLGILCPWLAKLWRWDGLTSLIDNALYFNRWFSFWCFSHYYTPITFDIFAVATPITFAIAAGATPFTVFA